MRAKLDFVHLGGVAKQALQVVEEGARDFDEIGIWRGCRKSGLGPQLAAHQGEGVGEGRDRFGVPGGLRDRGRGSSLELVVGEQRHQGEETEQRWGRAGDRTIGPLALGLDAQVGPHLVEGHFELPAQDEPGEDLLGIGFEVGTEQGLGGELLQGVANQDPADGHGREARRVPERRLGADRNRTIPLAVPARDREAPARPSPYRRDAS